MLVVVVVAVTLLLVTVTPASSYHYKHTTPLRSYSGRNNVPYKYSNSVHHGYSSTTVESRKDTKLFDANEAIAVCDRALSGPFGDILFDRSWCSSEDVTFQSFFSGLGGHIMFIISLLYANYSIKNSRNNEWEVVDEDDDFMDSGRPKSNSYRKSNRNDRYTEGDDFITEEFSYLEDDLVDDINDRNSNKMKRGYEKYAKNINVKDQINGRTVSATLVCPQCQGRGVYLDESCSLCGGVGVIEDFEDNTFYLPPKSSRADWEDDEL